MIVRRKKVNSSKMFGRLIVILVLMITISMALKTSASGQSYDSFKEVFIVQGDTLWDLSKKYKSEENIQKTVYEIMEFNNMKTCDVYPGQTIRIPLNS